MRKITSLLVVLLCLVPLWQAMAQAGNTCSDPIEIASLPYNTIDDTDNYTNEYSGPPGTGCGTASQYLSGNEAIYAYTATYTGELALTMNPEDTYAAFFVYNSCSDIGVVCASDGYAVNGNSSSPLDIMISIESGETYYIVVSMWADDDVDSFAYTLDVEEVSCSRPAVVTLESVSFGEAVISWQGNADSYEYVLGTSSSEPTAAGTITNDTEVLFEDLTEGSTYYFWVRSVCEDDEVSAWAAPVSFRSPGQGDTCDSAIVVESLPFTVTDNTNNYANEYTGTPGASCGTNSSYLDGNNVVYTYTATANTAVQINLESSVSNKGVFVYDDCNNIGSMCNVGAVESSSSEDIILDLYVNAGETYYVLLSTWPSPQTMPYTLSIEEITCAVPGSISLDAATPTSADFSWSAIDDVDSYDYAITTSNDEPTAEDGNTTDNEVALTDLTPDTNYYFWLRSVCGTTTTDWSAPYEFFSGYCAPVYTSTGSGDYFTEFEANSIIDFISYTASSVPDDRYENNSDVVLQVYEGQSVDFLTNYVGGNQGVKIWLDSNNNMQFEESEIIYSGTSSSSSQEGEFVIPSDLENGSYRMRIRGVFGSNTDFNACDSQTYGVALDYTFEVVDAPTCPHVENIVLDAATPNTATISWDSNDTAEGYIVEYGADGFEHGDGTTIEVTDNSVDLEGLIADTNYEVYVRADCGGDLSYWGAPLRFFTGYCSASTQFGEYVTAITTEGAILDLDYGATSQPDDGYDNQASMELVVFAGSEVDLSTTYSSGSHGLNVWIDWNNNMSFEDGEKVFTYSGEASQTGSLDLPSDMEPGSYRMRVRGQWGGSANPPACGEVNYGSTVDFTLVVIEMDCMPATEISFTSDDENNITMSWIGNDDVAEWEIEYGVRDFTQGEGTTVTTSDTSYLFDDLTLDTGYDFYITGDCSDAEGITIGPKRFYYGYCVPSTQYSEYLSEISTEGGLSNIDYTATSQPAGSYDNQSNIELVVLLGGQVDLSTVYSAGSHGLNVWVDWDNSLTFEEEEKIYTYNGTASQTGVLDFPADMEVGTYRMRIRGQYGTSANPPPCGQVNNGSTVDFTLNVVELDCMPAVDISFTAESDNNITMSWTGNDDVEEWEIEYGVRDFTEGEGATITTSDTSYLLTDLELDIEYDFYIKGDCADEEGLVIGPVRFYFGYCTPTYTGGDYLAEIHTENALNDISYEVTSKPDDGYDNQTEQSIVAFSGSEFDFNTRYVGGGQGVKVWIDIDNNMSFDNDEVVYFDHSSTATQNGVIEVPSGLEPGDYRIRFVSVYGTSSTIDDVCGTYTWGSAVDFTLTIVELDCMPAVDISFTADVNNNINMSWTGTEDVEEWEIEYGERGFAQGEGSVVTTGDTSYLFTDLELDTEYDFYITGDCADEEGITIGPKRFYFGYCSPTTQYGEYLAGISTDGGFIDFNYAATSQPNDSYDNQTETQLVVIPGMDVELSTVYSSGSNGVNAWVDWDNSLTFDESEKVYTNAGGGASQSGDFDFPTDMEPGVYRMRVRGQFGSSANPPACGQVNNGSTVDFTLVVLDPNSCLPPLDFETVSVGMTSIEIGWTDNSDDVETWEIEYGVTGFIPGDGTLLEVDTNPYLIDGLDNSTTYDFYVRAICADGEPGSWSPLPHTAGTLCGPSTVPYLIDFESSTAPELPDCSSQQVFGESNAWYTEYNPGYYLGETTVLRYDRSEDSVADAWFFTGGVELEAGTWYAVSYDYMIGNPQFAESFKVAMGTNASEDAMTTVLADYPELTISTVNQDLVEFRVAESGVYYFGFHAYSDAAQFSLFLDNIRVDYNLGVEDLKDITFTMYPNPATSNVQVESSSTIERITVYNMLGQTIENVKPMDTNYNLNVEDFQTGTYLLEIEADGKRQTKQLIKK